MEEYLGTGHFCLGKVCPCHSFKGENLFVGYIKYVMGIVLLITTILVMTSGVRPC